MQKPIKPTIDLDTRYFRRYPLQSNCQITIDNQSFSGQLINYSFKGLSFITKESIPLQIGDIIDLYIDILNLHQKGKVQWIKQLNSHKRVGVLKVGTVMGSFQHYHLSDILIGLQKTLKTGILDVTHGKINKKIYVRNGNIIFASSNQHKDSLGNILLQHKQITKSQYSNALAHQKKTQKPIAAVLVNLGYLKPKMLKNTVELQVKSIIGSIFNLVDALFEFHEEQFPLKGIVVLKVSVANLIYDEVKRTADVALLEAYLLNSVIEFSRTPLNLFQDINLDSSDRTILALVDGETRVKDILQLSLCSKTDTLKTIYALLEARILEIKKEGTDVQGIPLEEVLEEIQETPHELVEKIESMYSKCKKSNAYDLLGVRREANIEEIKKAYYKAAKEFHPDLHFQLSKNMKEKLVEIFTYITNAYLALKEREAREKDQSYPQTSEPTQTRVMQNAEIAASKFREGQGMHRKGKYEEAAYQFASAIYFNRSVAKYHYYYGCALVKLGNSKEAAKSLNKALELKPNDPSIFAELGHVYLALKFPLRAKGYFTKALQLSHTHKRALEGLAFVRKL